MGLRRPGGYRDIDGFVLIDGGLLGSFASADLQRAKRELADIRTGKVFLDLLGVGLPEINGIFAQVGALWAYKRPDEPSVLQGYPPLPDFLKPPMRVTNEAQFGYAFDETTSPAALALIHIRAGRLADSGDPRGWQGGELTPIRRHAKAYAADAPNATEWYYPRRLLLDFDAASPLRQTRAAGSSGFAVSTETRSTRRSTPTPRTSRAVASHVVRGGSRGSHASSARWSWTTATRRTWTRSRPRRGPTGS